MEALGNPEKRLKCTGSPEELDSNVPGAEAPANAISLTLSAEADEATKIGKQTRA